MELLLPFKSLMLPSSRFCSVKRLKEEIIRLIRVECLNGFADVEAQIKLMEVIIK